MNPLILQKEKVLMNKKFQLRWWMILSILMPLFAILFAGCEEERDTVIPTATLEITIPFETIENAESSWQVGYYREIEPKLVIITGLADVESLGATISQSSQEALQKMDFSQYFAIAVFQGLHGSDGYRVDIQQIGQDDDLLIIFAHFNELDPNLVGGQIETSPYHLIKIQKHGLTGKVNFMLNVDGEIIIQQSKYIP
jgi:hypothetical protein